jgi:hypothetical protein
MVGFIGKEALHKWLIFTLTFPSGAKARDFIGLLRHG